MLDIDYEGLWHRAQRTTINGRALMTLAPKDEVLALAMHGGQVAEYEELALALARAPERLTAIKAKLMRNRLTAPLFDTAQYTRDLESAYTTMWERTQRGEPPDSSSIASALHSTEIESPAPLATARG